MVNKWHTYTLEWTPDYLAVFVDSEMYFRYEKPENANQRNWPYDKPFRMIVNSAVGGKWGGSQGVDENVFPQNFTIDYIKVWLN